MSGLAAKSFSVNLSILAFDEVSVRGEGGDDRQSAEAFLARPRNEQTELILAHRVRFLDGGRPVARLDAIRSIKAAKLAG